MNVQYFIDHLVELLPPGKPLNNTQEWKLKEKLAKYSERELDRLCEAVIDNCKFFPKIPDLIEQAKALGLSAHSHAEYRPHTWEPTDCKLCVGSGMLAVYYSQEFEVSETAKTQCLRLHYVFPYHQSAEYQRRNDHTDIRFVHRCLCDAGAATTLDRGIPRWREDMPEFIRKGWAE